MQRDHVSNVAYVLDTNFNVFKEILNSLTDLLPSNKISAFQCWITNHHMWKHMEINSQFTTIFTFNLVLNSLCFWFTAYTVPSVSSS